METNTSSAKVVTSLDISNNNQTQQRQHNQPNDKKSENFQQNEIQPTTSSTGDSTSKLIYVAPADETSLAANMYNDFDCDASSKRSNHECDDASSLVSSRKTDITNSSQHQSHFGDDEDSRCDIDADWYEQRRKILNAEEASQRASNQSDEESSSEAITSTIVTKSRIGTTSDNLLSALYPSMIRSRSILNTPGIRNFKSINMSLNNDLESSCGKTADNNHNLSTILNDQSEIEYNNERKPIEKPVTDLTSSRLHIKDFEPKSCFCAFDFFQSFVFVITVVPKSSI